VKTLDAIVAEETASPRFRSILLGGIAFLGVTIAAVGLYGVVAYSVSQRTSEIAVRLVLGAHPRGVTRMVLKETFVWGVFGTTLGLGAAYAVTAIPACLRISGDRH
jgi:putative ABC transport system permease protein